MDNEELKQEYRQTFIRSILLNTQSPFDSHNTIQIFKKAFDLPLPNGQSFIKVGGIYNCTSHSTD